MGEGVLPSYSKICPSGHKSNSVGQQQEGSPSQLSSTQSDTNGNHSRSWGGSESTIERS
ncbi:MAG: hypothetical protein ACI9CD_000428 [Candidatus Deianiraeaceae bacterium]|jgi:hypothetical protein